MRRLILSTALFFLAGHAHAATGGIDLQRQPLRLNVQSEVVNYSSGHGRRHELSFDLTSKLGATTLFFEGATGRRDFGEHQFKGTMAAATLSRTWTTFLATRTSVSAATNSPVFATRSVMQEVSLKPGGGVVINSAARLARYYDDVGMTALSIGPVYYFPRGSVGYRFTRYHVDSMGKSGGHLVNFRLNDLSGRGSTQLWIGSAGSLIDSAFQPGIYEGRVRSIALRRIQPLSGRLALSVGLGRDGLESSTGKYRATRFAFGIVLTD